MLPTWAASNFTQRLLNDMHADGVTVILEEQALAPARVLARVPYLEHLLGLMQQGVSQINSLMPMSRLLRGPMPIWSPTWPHSWWASSIRFAWQPSLKHLLTIRSWGTPRLNDRP